MPDEKTLYVLELPNDPEIFRFFKFTKEQDGQYILQDVNKSIVNGALLFISPEDFEKYRIPLEHMDVDPDLLKVLYKNGSYEQQELFIFTDTFGVQKARLIMICGSLFLMIGTPTPYLFTMREFDRRWNAAFSEADLKKWLLHCENPGSGKRKHTMNYHTHGLAAYTGGRELQSVLALPYDVVRPVMDQIALSIAWEGLHLTDGMTVPVMDQTVCIKELDDENGRPAYRVIFPDKNGRFPWDSDVDPNFSIQTLPAKTLFYS